MPQKTDGFFKESKRDIYFKLREDEILALIDPDTGRVHKELSDPVKTCLICGSFLRDTLFWKYGFAFHRCRDCGFVYADPQVRETDLMHSYKGSSANDAWIDVLLSDANSEYDEYKFTEGLNKIESITGTCGRILDIGCSIGHFLKVAKARSWNVLGLEVNERALKHAREVWDIPVEAKLLDEANFEDCSFDAVTLWGVIEHLKDPLDVMQEIFRVLRPGGAVLIFCPNIDSLLCRVLHSEAPCIDGRNHCGYFSPLTLRFLLERCGFEVKSIVSHQANLSAIINYLEYKETFGSTLESNIFKTIGSGTFQFFENIILDRNLGYKIETLAQRPF